MFEDRNDYYQSMMVEDNRQQMAPQQSKQQVLGEIEGLIPDFNPWPMDSDNTSYAMEPSMSNSSSSSFSSVFPGSLSNSSPNMTSDEMFGWPMEHSNVGNSILDQPISMNSLSHNNNNTIASFQDPYRAALTPPSDTDGYTTNSIVPTLSPASSFYCEPSQTTTGSISMPVSAVTPHFSDVFTNDVNNFGQFPSSPPPSDPMPIDETSQSPLSSAPGSASNTPKPVVMPTTYTKWVKLTRMSEDRIEKIKQLANEKGIELETVESVLTLYCQNPKIDNDVNRFCGEDVFIKITMGGSSTTSTNDSDDAKSRRRRSDGSIAPKKKHRKQRPNYVKRPLNSFMLYRKSQTQSAMAYAISSKLKLNHQNISQIIGLMWQTESKELKEEFSKFAGQEKELHKAMHPDYKFCPQKKNKK